MHVLLVADGRSPNTRSWVQSLISLDLQVSLISTYPCDPFTNLGQVDVLPVAFAGLSGSQVPKGGVDQKRGPRRMVGRFRSLFLSGRYIFGPLTISQYIKRYHRLIETYQPDLVHALRIPFEGMLAAYTPPHIPMVVSIWGNDLTLHAGGSRWMRGYTRKTLTRTDGLMADAARDIHLAHAWGLSPEAPTLVVPGSGGINLKNIRSSRQQWNPVQMNAWPSPSTWVVNPRGFRPGSVRNDVFFQSIPLILERRKDVFFLCPGMEGQLEAQAWVDRLKIADHVCLLPYLTQYQLWDLFQRAVISVSISQHDGTPNSLLEAMACGCFPIAGDIESIREWIIPGVNGLLVEPSNPQGLAEVVLLAMNRPDLRSNAAAMNWEIIKQRVDIDLVRAKILGFYQSLLCKK
jgi:glycosyltransferase involved in cell wall biosynthesis